MQATARHLKTLDALVGPLLARLLPAPRGSLPGQPRSIAVIRPGGIGDAALLAPAIIRLHERFPAARITVLAEGRNGAVFSLMPHIAACWRYDRPVELWRFLRQKYDILIDSEQSHYLSAAVARLASAGLRIGFATNSRQRLFDHRVPYSHDWYEATSFLRLLAPLAGDSGLPPPPPFLVVPASACRQGKVLLTPLDGRRVVCLFPGASIPERRWGKERFRQVAVSLCQQGLGVVVVGGGADQEAGEHIVHGLTPALNLAGRTSLEETAAILARASLLISGDSGILHLAVGLNTPTVSLFGPGIAKKWAPPGNRHIVLNKQLPCSPCTRFGTTPPCPRKAACLAAITPAEVVKAAMRLLSCRTTKNGVQADAALMP